MKILGKEAGAIKSWDEIEIEVMYTAMVRKFSLNLELREKLLATGDKKTIKATTDKKWGSGLALKSSAMKCGECPGKNYQGKQLMRVRATLRKEIKAAKHH